MARVCSPKRNSSFPAITSLMTLDGVNHAYAKRRSRML